MDGFQRRFSVTLALLIKLLPTIETPCQPRSNLRIDGIERRNLGRHEAITAAVCCMEVAMVGTEGA